MIALEVKTIILAVAQRQEFYAHESERLRAVPGICAGFQADVKGFPELKSSPAHP
jgi:hypothetical protein